MHKIYIFVLLLIASAMMIIPVSLGLNSICIGGTSEDYCDAWSYERSVFNRYYTDWFGEPCLSTVSSDDEIESIFSGNDDMAGYAAFAHGNHLSCSLLFGPTSLTAGEIHDMMDGREPFHFVALFHCGGLDMHGPGSFAYELVKGDFSESLVIGLYGISGDDSLEEFRSAKEACWHFLEECDQRRDTSFDVIYGEMEDNPVFSFGCEHFLAIGNMSLSLNDIISMHSHHPQSDEITILSPNGGESFCFNDTVGIQWSSTGTSDICCDLYRSDTWCARLAVLPSSGSWQWMIEPSRYVFPGDSYSLQMTNSEGTYDRSDSFFSIMEEPVTLVVSPNGGEAWVRGSEVFISWESSSPYNLRVDLYKGGEYCRWLTILPPGGGTASFFVPVSVSPGDDYQLHIYDGYGESDLSDGYFTIADYEIKVLSPNGGEAISVPGSFEVSWATSLSGCMYVTIFKGDEPYVCFPLSTSPSMVSISEESLEHFPLGTDFRVRVSDTMGAADNGNYDYSDGYFTIYSDGGGEPVPTSVVSPNGGEAWVRGSEVFISWESSSPYNLRVDLYKGGEYCRWLTILPPGGGTASFFVPVSVSPGDDYQLHIYDGYGESDMSDSFFSIESGDDGILEGDLNNDSAVNILDIIIICRHLGETGEGGWIPADLNTDGVINILDIITACKNWG